MPSTPPPNSASNSGSSSTENSPNIDGERGDLIEFYNKVMVYFSKDLFFLSYISTQMEIQNSALKIVKTETEF